MTFRNRISLAMMVHDERDELAYLLSRLGPHIARFHEFVVIDDFSTEPIDGLLAPFGAKIERRALDGDFAGQRNFMKAQCAGDFIFFLDPDEVPGPALIDSLDDIVETMARLDAGVCRVARLNLHNDGDGFVPAEAAPATQEMLDAQQPDWQVRLIANRPDLRWVNKVHERVVGGRRGLQLPARLDYALLHVKAAARQERQNAFYARLARRTPKEWARALGLGRLARKLGLVRDPDWAIYAAPRRTASDR